MKILGLDYGERRTGVALSLEGVIETRPVIEERGGELAKRVGEFCQKEGGIELILVGLPQGRMRKRVTGFVKRLRKIVKLPVELVDESLTSWEAKKKGRYLKKKKGESLDSLAAALIIERFLVKKKGGG